MNSENKNKTKNQETRAWWEIPARGSVLILLVLILLPGHYYRAAYLYTIGKFFPETVESRVESCQKKVEKRFALKEPPTEARIVFLKAEKQVEIWGKKSDGTWKKLNYHPIFGIPEENGPKLKKGESKTPEGFYKIGQLDPNSTFYLALKLDYPSAEDLEIARAEKRDPESMKADFLVHGFGHSNQNIAVPDGAMEEIFYLAQKTGLEKITVLITPMDFRKEPLPEHVKPDWLRKRYEKLKLELDSLKEK